MQLTPQWQSKREPSPYVMYSLKHSVNLSRRACWTCFLVLAVTISCGAGEGLEKNNNAGDGLMYPRPDLEPLPQDFNKPYDRVKFGPMGPSEANVVQAAKLSSTTEQSAEAKPIKRYPVASVSFQRVETPFIIGLWIFCASLAKIGKSALFVATN